MKTFSNTCQHRLVSFHRSVIADRAAISCACDATTVGQEEAQQVAQQWPSAKRSPFLTGGRVGTTGSSLSILPPEKLPLKSDKQIIVVRHGQSEWNLEGRIQGSSDESHLTSFGREQAVLTRKALFDYPFGACFSSPISRAKEFADVLWEGYDVPVIHDDNLMEANLGWLEGMTNAHAAKEHAEVYGAWRTKPEQFEIDGRRPILEVFDKAAMAWQEIVQHSSDVVLVVTHKSILRALICTAIGLGPESFRAVDVHNAGVTCFWVNNNAEAMLQHLNMTSHLDYTLRY